MTYGVLPERERFLAHCAARTDDDGEPDPVEAYPMKIVDDGEWAALAAAVNQGIDSHLEAVACEERAYGHSGAGYLTVLDAGSLHTLIRRLIETADWSACGEDDTPPGLALASNILDTIGIEWV
jgi:hypothetical protein